jgi:protocatechuate 3,4-dioxygenase beta subunit
MGDMDQATDRATNHAIDEATTDRSAPLVGRRRALTLFGGVGLAVLAGCGSGDDTDDAASTSSTSSASTSTTAGAAANQSAEAIPEETAGPFPGDGSNGPDVLSQDGVVRSDIRSSFGSASGVAEGVPLTVDLTVVDSASGSPLSGGAVYIWHCDRDGQYSMYDQISEENYLRGVQETDGSGKVSFTSIFPAAYQGRWPHIHFEVYGSVADATGGGETLVTSQLAFPEDVCEQVYTTADGYTQSESNMERTSLDGDMVFSDGYDDQLATVTGSVDDGYVAELTFSV